MQHRPVDGTPVIPFQNTPASFRVLPGQRFFDVKHLGSADDLPRDGKPPALGRRQTAQRCAPAHPQPPWRPARRRPCPVCPPSARTDAGKRPYPFCRKSLRPHARSQRCARFGPAPRAKARKAPAHTRSSRHSRRLSAAVPGCVRQRRTAFHVSFPPRSVPKTLCRRRRPFCRPRPAPSKIQPSCAAFGRSWRAASRR